MLAHVLGRERAWLLAHPEYHLQDCQLESFIALVNRRCSHEPVAYLVGHKEFFGLDFAVTPAVLVPRPETELLVELALEHVADRNKSLWIADVGTGSGVLAISLAVHLPRARVVATDISAQALQLARHNAHRHGVSDRVMFVQTDLLSPLQASFDLVLANPPYLCKDELPTTQSAINVGDLEGENGSSVRCRVMRGRLREEMLEARLALAWEPRIALDGGVDGLHVIGRLLTQMPQHLCPGGLFIMEIGAAQAETVLEMAYTLFPRAQVSIQRDYAGLERALVLVAA